MQIIERAEDFLFEKGFHDARVRHYGDHARVEVPRADLDRLRAMGKELEDALTDLGFPRVDIDEEGLVSGKLNRAWMEGGRSLK
ncbi:MAG: hypothetical protein R2751_08995 [Bacteroidales bacterium]